MVVIDPEEQKWESSLWTHESTMSHYPFGLYANIRLLTLSEQRQAFESWVPESSGPNTMVPIALPLVVALHYITWELIVKYCVAKMMQTAWRERNPVARIKAANDALEKNPECAPAYILLAEEEATTILEAEKILKQALKVAESNYRKSQQTQHQGTVMEAIHSESQF
ncbi:unnamed protein product [Timema podura]|uniref:Protein ST7 homolog n=1 Tax=Timema podura TaxID=61482 RepID=A0ABN7NJB0_TIMPD|nr:unnamed protein product [Timema podura]